MKIGDQIRRKDDHSETSWVIDIEVTYARGYGFGKRIRIPSPSGMGTMLVPANDWEVIKD